MRFFRWVVLLSLLLSTTGCGGCSTTSSVAEMKRRAAMRQRDTNEDAESVDETPAAPPPAPAATNSPPNTSPATTTAASTRPAPTPSPGPAVTRPQAKPITPGPDNWPLSNATANTTPAPENPATAATTAVIPGGKEPGGNNPAFAARKQTIANLQKIGAALEAYVKAKGTYPRIGIFDRFEESVELSWRVELLPYLGYQSLYSKFNHGENWNSPHNRALLKQMPAEYRIAGRQDEKTQYLAVNWTSGAFRGDTKARKPSEFTDGLAATILVLEVDDALATEWTRPEDFTPNQGEPRSGLFNTREDGLFAVVGGGAVRRLSPETMNDQLLALFTVAGGEKVPAEQLLLAANIVPDPRYGAAVAAKATPSPETVPATPSPLAPAVPGRVTDPTPRPVQPSPMDEPPVAISLVDLGIASPPGGPELRLAVPDAESQAAGLKILAELYKPDYDRAKTKAQRAALAKHLLEKAPEMESDATGQYLLLDLARKLSVDAVDVATALRAVDELAIAFRIDAPAEKLKVLDRLASDFGSDAEATLIFSACETMLAEAVKHNDFERGAKIIELAQHAAKRAKRNSDAQLWATRKKFLDEAKSAYAPILQAVTQLKANPAHPEANTEVGKYLCFYRRDWDRGLVHLAQGGDIRLKVLAQIDRSRPASPQQRADLGDQWYDLCKEARPWAQQSLALRASYWYDQAVAELPGGLIKSRVQKRQLEIADLTGAKKAAATSDE